MSFIGFVSFPILFMSLLFIFFHSKLTGLYNAFIANQNAMFKLVRHKLELLLFFAHENLAEHEILQLESGVSGFDTLILDLRLQFISELEISLCNFDFTDEDRAELADINKEIEEAQNMYNLSKEDLYGFTSKLPGKLFATLLADKSLK